MKKEVVVIGLLIVIIALLVLFPRSESRELTDAKKFIDEHLRSKYPDADVIEVVQEPSAPMGFVSLKARVTREYATPCPERVHEYFNVSVQNIRNFVTAPPEYITRGCKVCAGQEQCILAFEEEAIIASHTDEDSGRVRQYIADYPDAKPLVPVAFLRSYGSAGDEAWNVSWSSQNATYSVYATILKNGNRVAESGVLAK